MIERLLAEMVSTATALAMARRGASPREIALAGSALVWCCAWVRSLDAADEVVS